MATDERGAGFIAGLILGGLVGAAVGLLLAPQAGEETREQLREKGIELRTRADEFATRARSQVADAVEEGKRAAERTRSELEARLQAERGQGVS